MEILEQLGISDKNSGACTGPDKWVQTHGGDVLQSFSPTSGDLIANVSVCGIGDYETS